MRRAPLRNLPASVRQRLYNLANKRSYPFEWILTRYALERLLYRLGRSEWNDRFLLKGAMLFSLWYDAPQRLTRDLDLLGYGFSDIDHLKEIFEALCGVEVEADGLEFLPETVRVAAIREDEEYHGARIQLKANLDGAIIHLQIDVGFGDAVTPTPEKITYPTLLDFPAPELRAYPSYTVVSEKLQAMVMLGMANSRMKDFYDVWVMAHRLDFDGLTLGRAIEATFERRHTVLPVEIPIALTDAFANDPDKKTQWDAFLTKSGLQADGTELVDVICFLQSFLWPPVLAAAEGRAFLMVWPVGGPWERSD